MAGNDLTLREMLIEMNGKLDGIALEHAHTREAVVEVKQKQHALANTVMTMQHEQASFNGERKGFMFGARAIVFLSGVSGLGGVAAFAKTFLTHGGG